jgi:hypothetical protein
MKNTNQMYLSAQEVANILEMSGQEKEKGEKGFPHQSGSHPVGYGFLATVTK